MEESQNSYTTPPPAAKKPRLHQRESTKSILSTIAIFVLAPLTALLLTAFVFQSYQVDGPSMEDTLHHGDRLIVSKVSKTWSKITGNTYIPGRGDIIIFHRTGGSFGEDKQLIKRVVGLPGERVVVANGQITVYNEENPEGFQPDQQIPETKAIASTQGDVDLTLPEDGVFVAGDNRDDSLDSRNFGAVRAKDIVGTLEFRVFPFDKAEKF